MEKIRLYLVWLWKISKKQKREWIRLGLLVIVLVFLGSYRISDNADTMIGIVYPQTEIAKQIVDDICENKRSLEFVVYKDTDEMIKDELSGILDCGFIFCEDFDEKFQSGDLSDSISYSYTPFTTKGSVAKEYVYAGILKKYSIIILKKEVGAYLAEEKNTDLLNAYLEGRCEEYIKSDAIFHIELYNIDGRKVDRVQDSEKGRNLMRGLTGIILFAMILFSMISEKKKAYYGFLELLDKRNKSDFCIALYISTITVPVVLSTLFLMVYDQSLFWGVQILKMFLFIFITAIYVAVLWKCRLKSDTLMVAILSLCVLQIIINPVFTDLGSFFPAIRIIRLFTPLGYFM